MNGAQLVVSSWTLILMISISMLLAHWISRTRTESHVELDSYNFDFDAVDPSYRQY